YTLTVHNAGPDAATGAYVEAQFGAADTYTLTPGSISGCTGAPAQTLHCPLPTLASGQSLSWKWTVATGAVVGQRSLTASIVADSNRTTDASPANNSALAAVTVRAVSEL